MPRRILVDDLEQRLRANGWTPEGQQGVSPHCDWTLCWVLRDTWPGKPIFRRTRRLTFTAARVGAADRLTVNGRVRFQLDDQFSVRRMFVSQLGALAIIGPERTPDP